MALLNLNQDKLNAVLNRLAPAWVNCIDPETIAKAQVKQSPTRNWVFATIINKKFIKLRKACNGHKAGSVVALTDIYNEDSASNIAGLIIYRLGNSGLQHEPVIVEA